MVLIVEDDSTNRRIFKHILRREGGQVVLACNGVEAVELAARTAFSLILMDCQMPEMDGYQATAAIRSGKGLSRGTPIVALTAKVIPEDRRRCLDAGMDDYLPKPLEAALLRATVRRWLLSAA